MFQKVLGQYVAPCANRMIHHKTKTNAFPIERGNRPLYSQDSFLPKTLLISPWSHQVGKQYMTVCYDLVPPCSSHVAPRSSILPGQLGSSEIPVDSGGVA